MKALLLLLLFAIASQADSIPELQPISDSTKVGLDKPSIQYIPASSSGITSLDGCKELEASKQWECARALKKGGDYNPKRIRITEAKWDTVTTISVDSNGDTTKSITIQRSQDWDGYKEDMHKLAGVAQIMLGIQVLSILLATLVLIAI